MTVGEGPDPDDGDIKDIKIKMKATSRDSIHLQQKIEKLARMEEEILEQKICKDFSVSKDEISTMKGEIKTGLKKLLNMTMTNRRKLLCFRFNLRNLDLRVKLHCTQNEFIFGRIHKRMHHNFIIIIL